MKEESSKIQVITTTTTTITTIPDTTNTIKKNHKLDIRIFLAVVLMLIVLIGIVELMTSLHGFSLLRESKEEDKNTWGAVCKTNTAGGYNTTTLKHCLNLDGFSDAYTWSFVLAWASIVTLLIGFIGLLLFLCCKNQRCSASQWLKTMALYPFFLGIFVLATMSFAKNTGSISGIMSLFYSFITVTATTKLWDEFWKYLDLYKEEKQQKLA